MNEPRNSNASDGTHWPQRVTAIAGAITAVAGFVVIPGTIAMVVRLNRAELPDDLGIVVSLPGEFLLALGLGYVLGPLLLVIVLALAVTWLPGERGSVTPALAQESAEWWHFVLLGAFGLLAAVGLPFAVYGWFPPWPAFVFSALSVAGFLGAAWVIGQLKDKLTRAMAFGLVAMAAAVAFVGWAVLFAGVRAEFPRTTVCLNGGRQVDGVLVGRTSDTLYVGEPLNRVALLGIEDPVVRSNIIGGLRAHDFGFNELEKAEESTFQKADVVITDLPDGFQGSRIPQDAGVPIIGYYADTDEVDPSREDDAKARGIDVVASEADVRRPDALNGLVGQALDSIPHYREALRPPRRIAALPTSEVSGYRVGAAGPCPIAG